MNTLALEPSVRNGDLPPAPTVNSSALDPVIVNIAQMVDLLKPVAGKSDAFELNEEWFQNPLEKTSQGIQNNGTQIAELLEQLLGQVGGHALGIPVQDPAILGTWYPLRKPGSDEVTGLYIVSYERDGNQIFGLGTLHTWSVSLSSQNLKIKGPQKIAVKVWGLIPLVQVGKGTFSRVLGAANNPFVLGIAIESPSGPLIDVSGFSFIGVKVSANIDIAAKDAASILNISLVILQLQLPGETKPSDRSLADLANISSEDILNTISSLFTTALMEVSGQSPRAAYLLPVLGLSRTVPNSDTKLPLLRWDLFLSLAIQKQNLAEPFIDWFTSLLSNSDYVKVWLTSIGGLMGVPNLIVTGDGSRLNPYLIPLIEISTIGTLSFSVGSPVNEQGTRYFYPGLKFAAKGVQLGTSDAQLTIQADLELAQFALLPGASGLTADPTSLQFDSGIVLVNKDSSQPLFSGEIDGQQYSFGSLRGGLTLNGDRQVIPAFQLVDVRTPNNAYDEIDLTAPNELVNTVTDNLGTLIEAAFKKLFGVEGGNYIRFGSNIAALIGVITPQVPQGITWPSSQLAPPFSPYASGQQLTEAIQSPIAAIGRYYATLLQSNIQVDGKIPFHYLLLELAGLLQISQITQPIVISGDGTPTSPWKAILTDLSLPAALTAYVSEIDRDTIRLFFGLDMSPEIVTQGGTKLVSTVAVQILSLDLPKSPDSSVSFNGTWLPNIQTAITLPEGFTTPAVLGSQLKVDRADIFARWSRFEGWHWSIQADKPTLIVPGESYPPIAESLNFSDAQSLRELVTQTEQTFAPVLVRVLGNAISRTDTRAGWAVTGILGLLPNLSQPFAQKGLTWPQDMPVLQLQQLHNPIPVIRQQIAALFATPEKGTAALSLLSWGLGDDTPSVTGGGTFEVPYQIKIGQTFNWDLVLWLENSALGIGLGRTDIQTVSNIQVTAETRLNIVNVSLDTGNLQTRAEVPSLSFLTAFESSQGIVPSVLQKLVLGFNVDFTAEGTLNITPIVQLHNVQFLGADSAFDLISLADLANSSTAVEQEFLTVLNEGIQVVVSELKDNSTFQTVYELLVSIGLALPVNQSGDLLYGINPNAARGLLANPTHYLQTQFAQLLLDVGQRNKLFQLIQEILGITLPEIPTEVLEVLAALDLVESGERGYAIKLDAILQLASHPFQTLSNRFLQLVRDEANLKAIVSALNQNIPATDFGIFTFTALSGTEIQLAIKPEKAFAIGTLLKVSGTVDLNLAERAIAVQTRLYSEAIGLSLVSTLAFKVPDTGTPTADFNVQFAWGNAALPAPAPLKIYPFNSDRFINDLADLAPAYVLSAFVTGVMDSEILQRYPLAQVAFAGIGIAKQNEAGQWYMPSLMGLLEDPEKWLLSDTILGISNGGHFNLDKFQEILKSLPNVSSSNGISVQQIKNGARIAGLPYQMQIDILADLQNKQAWFKPVLSQAISVAGNKGQLETLALSLSLGENYQPGIGGTLLVSGDVGLSDRIFVQTGYNQEKFALTVGERGDGNPQLQILPFDTWTTLLLEVAKIVEQQLLQQLTQKLLDKLAQQGAATFVDKLRKAGQGLQVDSLVQRIIQAQPNLNQIEQVALTWLTERVNSTNITASTQAISQLFDGIISGVTAQDGLIRYVPSQNLPLTLLLGKTTLNNIEQVGLWTQLELPELSLLKANIKQTGIGIPLQGQIEPLFNFGVDITVPIDGDRGPQLLFDFNASAKCFDLSFDPIGNNSELQKELLPNFFGNAPDKSQAVEEWLIEILVQVVPRYVSIIVLNTDTFSQWLNSPIVTSGPTPGTILIASQLLVKPGDRYQLNTLEALKALTVETFIGKFLKALLQQEIRLLQFGDKGEIWIGPNATDANYYGFRLVAPNLKISRIPNLVIQLGAENTEWITESGGSPANQQAGIGAYIPIPNDQPSFEDLWFNFNNIGIDFQGKNGIPLVNLERFRLEAIKPRTFFSLKFNQGTPTIDLGGGITLDRIAIALSPNTATGASNNPIAQNLLGSGSQTQPNQKNPPANPTFSVTAAYTKNLYVELFNDTGASETELWFSIQRSFGPLYADKIGVGWEQQPKLADFLFNGNVSLAGLSVDLMGLKVGIPVTDPTNYNSYILDLAGLDITYNGGSVQIAGGFLKAENPLRYDGFALVKAAMFSLSAVGSYAEVPTNPEDPNSPTVPSLFIFAHLSAPLGGPPAFFITGLAAGFSYNRNIILPEVSEIQDFILVKGAGANSPFHEGESAGSALSQLSEVVYPDIGQYWIAAGIQFSSFQLVDAFALLFIKFGREFEIDLIGLALLKLPKGTPPNTALAYVELGLKVSFKPDLGEIAVYAQLTPNSYVLYKDCKLTGGFAFVLWFSPSPHAGDFVITLGGYHPAFNKPDHYPIVPRLGFNWPVYTPVGNVSISGGAYFALTPSAVMAGGYLKILFEAGPLRAWLNAGADFLIAWKPFYYLIGVEVTVGVAFQIDIAGVSITLKVELGASLEIYGPPTAGKVYVSWYVISFTIPFGDQDQNKGSQKPLEWDDFASTFLPPPTQPTQRSLARLAQEASTEEQQVVKLVADSGLIADDPATGWVIQPVYFTLRVDSAIPATRIDVAGTNWSAIGQPMGIRPMDVSSTDTPITVQIQSVTTGKPADLTQGVEFYQTLNGSPDALWGKMFFDPEGKPSADLTPGALFGVQIQGKGFICVNAVGPMDLLKAFGYEKKPNLPLPYSQTPNYPPSQLNTQGLPQACQANQPIACLMQTIMEPNLVIPKRNQIFAVLNQVGFLAPLDPSLYIMQSSADDILQAPPILASIGVYLSDSIELGMVVTRSLPPTETAQRASAVPTPPRLVGGMRRYRLSQELAVSSTFSSRMARSVQVIGRWIDANHTKSHPQQLLNQFAIASESIAVDSQTQRSKLYEGSIMLWELGASSRGVRLDVQGELPVRLTCFNSYHELIADYHQCVPGTSLTVPQATAHLAVEGLERSANNDLHIGWQLDSNLLKINHYYILGDGFILRPQAALRLRNKRRLFRRGLVDGRQILAENQIQTAAGGLKPGWVETIVPSSYSGFVVLVNRGSSSVRDAEQGLRVGAAYATNPEVATYNDAPTLVNANEYENECAFFYQVSPCRDRDTLPYLSILTQVQAESWQLLGVCVLAEDVTYERTSTQTLNVRSGCGVALEEREPPATVVTLIW